MDEACKEAMVFVTATGCKSILRPHHFEQVHTLWLNLGNRGNI